MAIVDLKSDLSQIRTKFGSITKTAGKAIGIPGLATGGIVNTPTTVNIAEKGPEAVVPLGKKFDMTETNKILNTIVGTQERIITRLADIGTA